MCLESYRVLEVGGWVAGSPACVRVCAKFPIDLRGGIWAFCLKTPAWDRGGDFMKTFA